MIDRDRTTNDVKNIINELLCICAWQIHACLAVSGMLVPLESHFSRQYAPFCLMDINLLESIRIDQGKRSFDVKKNVRSCRPKATIF
jgi:hypothetical protein